MATTPQPDLTQAAALPEPRPRMSFEEFKAAVEAYRAAVLPHIPEDWDLDAEMEAEHKAVLAGIDV